MRTTEIYNLTCHACGKDLEVKAGPQPGVSTYACPRCGVALVIEFRPALPARREVAP